MKLTQGAMKALNRLTDGKQYRTCKKCGFTLPKYAGRYPKNCPACGMKVQDDKAVA